MKKFIKLTNLVINTSKIIKIDILENKYCVHISSWIFYGNSFLDTNNNVINICKNKNLTDYQIINKWICSNTYNSY